MVRAATELKNRGISSAMETVKTHEPLPIRVLGTTQGNLVWVEHEPPDEKVGRIIIPQIAQGGGIDSTPNSKVFARVVAVGPGRILPKFAETWDLLANTREAAFVQHVPKLREWAAPKLSVADAYFAKDPGTDGQWRLKPGVKVGDRVVLGCYEGHHLRAFDRDLVCVYEHAIDGVVEE